MANSIVGLFLLSCLLLTQQTKAEGTWEYSYFFHGGCCDLEVSNYAESTAIGTVFEIQHKSQLFDPGFIIGCFDVKNNWNDGTGGYVNTTPLNGGIGRDFVTLDFKSQKGRGFSFGITLYKTCDEKTKKPYTFQ